MLVPLPIAVGVFVVAIPCTLWLGIRLIGLVVELLSGRDKHRRSRSRVTHGRRKPQRPVCGSVDNGRPRNVEKLGRVGVRVSLDTPSGGAEFTDVPKEANSNIADKRL